MKLDVMVIASHPDDAELACAGTICKLVKAGKKVGIVDLTRGELGSRGTPEIRAEEAANAAEIMGIQVRENLGLRDGFFQQDEANQLPIIRVIRAYQPEVVITNAPADRHPDHGRASKLVRDAAFLSGLIRIPTEYNGKTQEAWRPRRVFYFIQDYNLTPSFVVDISDFFEKKMEAIAAYRTQFYNPGEEGVETYISSRDFWHFLEARARNIGHLVGYTFGEGFISETPLGVDSPLVPD